MDGHVSADMQDEGDTQLMHTLGELVVVLERVGLEHLGAEDLPRRRRVADGDDRGAGLDGALRIGRQQLDDVVQPLLRLRRILAQLLVERDGVDDGGRRRDRPGQRDDDRHIRMGGGRQARRLHHIRHRCALSRRYMTKFVVFIPSTCGMKLAWVWLQAWQRGYIMAIAVRVLSTSEDPPSHRP